MTMINGTMVQVTSSGVLWVGPPVSATCVRRRYLYMNQNITPTITTKKPAQTHVMAMKYRSTTGASVDACSGIQKPPPKAITPQMSHAGMDAIALTIVHHRSGAVPAST